MLSQEDPALSPFILLPLLLLGFLKSPLLVKTQNVLCLVRAEIKKVLNLYRRH